MKKVLFVATVVKKHINAFHLPYLKWFKDNGFETHVCARNDYGTTPINIPYCDFYYDVPFERSPIKTKNLKAYKYLYEIISNNDFEVIHCHTPMGGVMSRIAAIKSRKNGTKVIYTAHGFHFYKGSPLINWISYFPVEKVLSYYTDALITINSEDYSIAKERMKSERVYLINGVGVDTQQFSPPENQLEKTKLRKEYGFSQEEKLLIYVGELSFRKRQDLLIETMKNLVHFNENVKLLLVGEGVMADKYKKMVNDYKLNDKVLFLGFRNDVDKLMKLSDVALSTSRQEGLPVNVIEAMACGLPLIVSDCRGNRDLVIDGINGRIFKGDNAEELAKLINEIIDNEKLLNDYGIQSEIFSKNYELKTVKDEMSLLYREILENI